MYALKGFLTIDELTSNVKGVVANHGEISTYSETFSRDVGKYSNTTNRGIQLLSFSSKNNGVDATVPDEVATHVLAVFDWLLTESKLATITSSQAALLQALDTQYDGVIMDADAGVMGQTNSLWFPEWLSWTFIGTENFEIRVWLSDAAFKSQYDEYEIVVIPPVAAVDTLVGTFDAVKAAVASKSVSQLIEQIRVETATNPCTMVLTENYIWTDPLDPANTVSTPWSLVIRGNAGNNPDAIKTVIKSYILTNSSHADTIWGDYIPDIFKSTEFILVPLWTQFAVPNLELAKGVYSPMIQYGEVLNTVKPAFYGYANAHIMAYMTLFDTMYNSIAVAACGSEQNRNAVYSLKAKFSDYICVPSTDADFNRMDTVTQTWVTKMMDLLAVAEDMTQFSDVPVGYSRTIRNGIVYACMPYMDVLYLVITKTSYAAL